ncbi:hypothetical protein AMTR_s00068p00058140 [Amborella trichopoda]|uniref:SWIM-type domain-containing protein n=1 Tax=Amborella trichopoda TaxID=13333 RepID=U5DDT3_AMBTC|nr:hypothetical protein AMTR_s00068p00058140 [Amborella trichopoda]
MDSQFEIHYLGKKCVVDLRHWTCNCKKWQLSGISCGHAIVAINHMNLDPIAYCLQYFTVEYFKKALSLGHVLEDIELTGMFNWIVFPPRTTRLPDKPKKHRKLSETEQPITKPLKCNDAAQWVIIGGYAENFSVVNLVFMYQIINLMN